MESLAVDFLSICEVLDQKSCLPVETPTDLLQGLANTSHMRFAKVFADYRADVDNPMNSTKLEGTTLEQVVKILKTVQGMHNSYCLTTSDDAWIGTGRLSSYIMGTGKTKRTIKCDNCLAEHYLKHCKKKMNDVKIVKNKAARGAPASSYRGGGGRGGGRGGERGNAGRGCGHEPRGKDRPPANYDSRGKFGAPEPHERVCVVDGKAFTACRTCGWNDAEGCHSSGSHELSLERGHVTSPFLQHEMDVALQRAGDHCNVAGGGISRSSGGSTALTIHVMTDMCSEIETGHEDAETSKMAGIFSSAEGNGKRVAQHLAFGLDVARVFLPMMHLLICFGFLCLLYKCYDLEIYSFMQFPSTSYYALLPLPTPQLAKIFRTDVLHCLRISFEARFGQHTDVLEQQMADPFMMAMLCHQDILQAFAISSDLWISSRGFGLCDACVQCCTSHYKMCDTCVGTR